MSVRADAPPPRPKPDWFNRAIGIGQLATSVVVVVLAAYLVHGQRVIERRDIAASEGHATARAYAVQLGQVARGVEDMLVCKEKLLQFAEGAGTRVGFSDLKILGAVLTTPELTQVQQASNQLDRLYDPGYSAPPAGSVAAYSAWQRNPVLQARTRRADELIRQALRVLGGVEPTPDRCSHT